jgi:hypothetical protein
MFRIRDPEKVIPDPDPGSLGYKSTGTRILDPGSGSATLLTQQSKEAKLVGTSVR